MKRILSSTWIICSSQGRRLAHSSKFRRKTSNWRRLKSKVSLSLKGQQHSINKAKWWIVYRVTTWRLAGEVNPHHALRKKTLHTGSKVKSVLLTKWLRIKTVFWQGCRDATSKYPKANRWAVSTCLIKHSCASSKLKTTRLLESMWHHRLKSKISSAKWWTSGWASARWRV